MPDLDTMAKVFKHGCETWRQEVAFRDKEFGIWNEYRWEDSYRNVKFFSLGLISLGLEPGDKVAIIGDNEPHWYWAALAAQVGRGVVVGLFTDAIPSEIQYIVNHSDSKFVVARDQEQVDKFLAIGMENLPNLKKIIWWYERGMRGYDEPFLLSFDQVMELGKAFETSHPTLFEERIAEGNGEDIAYIFYTSGTTGLPKGAQIDQSTLMTWVRQEMAFAPLTQRDNILCYLPPAWAGETMTTIMPHLLTGAKMNTLEEPETLMQDIREIGPTMIMGGPRQWEGWVSTIRFKIAEAGMLEKFVYNLFLPVAFKVADLRGREEEPSLFWKSIHGLTDFVLLKPIRDYLGLSKNHYCITGGALLGPDTFRFLSALGIKLMQWYGTSEGGWLTGHCSDSVKWGTIGLPFPGVEIRLLEDGEAVRRGYIFSGYYKNPEATSETIRGEWWHSGDGVYFDDSTEHFIFLDRLSEMGELRSGVKYSPQYVESNLRFSPYIKDVIVIGGKERDYVTAIVNIDFANVGRWAERHRVTFTTFTDLSQKPEVGELIREDIERVNKNIPPATNVKRYVCLHKEFDPDEADLTRTRKLKRTSITQRYREVVDALYGDKEGVALETPVTYQDGKTAVITTTLRVWSVEK